MKTINQNQLVEHCIANSDREVNLHFNISKIALKIMEMQMFPKGAHIIEFSCTPIPTKGNNEK